MNLSRDAIVARAREFKNVPYQHQGRTLHGLDCLGLCWATYTHFVHLGVEDFGGDVSSWEYLHNYERQPDPARMQTIIGYWFDTIPLETALPGDMIWMSIQGHPRHMGILTGVDPLRMIHAYGQLGRDSERSQVGKVVEHDIDPKWERRIHRALRLKGL